MYIHVSLPAKPVHSLNNLNFEDYVWCLVTLNTDKILVCVVYRAPSSTMDNESRIFTPLNDLQRFQHHSLLLLMGNFNLPNIDWMNNTVNGENNTLPQNFLMLLGMLC